MNAVKRSEMWLEQGLYKAFWATLRILAFPEYSAEPLQVFSKAVTSSDLNFERTTLATQNIEKLLQYFRLNMRLF